MTSVGIVTDVGDLTSSWMSQVLGTDVDIVGAEPVGTGQIGTCFRLRLSGPDVPTRVPETVLVKLPAADPGTREMLAGAYRNEVRFYAEIAATVDVRIPAVLHAAMAEGTGDFTLVMEDLSPAVQGDQIAGCTPIQARDAAVNLAGLHGPRWCDPSLLDLEGLSLNGPDDAQLLAELYGPATEIFLDGLGDLVSAEDAETLRRCVDVTEAWALGRAERFGLVHGDYRLDNLMFPPDGSAGCVAVDWQTLSLALPARDLAYLVATSLPPEVRRAEERALVAAYHERLVMYGVTGYDAAACWDDYRFAMLQGPLVSVFGCAYGTRTDRGDRMFAVMTARACAAIRDLGSLELASA